MSHLHSDSYNEHLLYAQRLGGSSSPPTSGDENPQEAPPARADNDSPPIAEKEETFIQQYLSLIITAILALSLIGLVFGLIPYYAVSAATNNHYNEMLYWTAGFFVLIAVPVSVHGIIKHLVNYYMPQVQKYVVRILFMVPIFSIQSWFSLFFHGAVEYIRAFRELYEAFVLSSFVYYIIELMGGDEQLALRLRTKDPKLGQHGFFGRLFGSWAMGRPFVLNCKYGVLQYVLVKIFATIAVIVLKSLGKFTSGDWGWNSSYTYIAIILNVSMGYALYCLVKLYYATKEDLKEWNPVAKFLCIKGIIFFTFWQGFVIEILHSVGVIQGVGRWDSEHVVDGLQDFLISFEMVFFAIAHRYAFPHTDYIHYLQRHELSGKQSSSLGWRRGGGQESSAAEETLFLFDDDHNVVNEPSSAVDVEYEPPSVSQLDRPMSVSRALMGVVPNETFSDIARMSMGGRVVVGEGDGGGSSGARGSTGLSEGADIVFSREHAEGI